MSIFDDLIRVDEKGAIIYNNWIEWNHLLIPNKPEWLREIIRNLMTLFAHCLNCTALDGCYLLDNNRPDQPLHLNCDCKKNYVSFSKVKMKRCKKMKERLYLEIEKAIKDGYTIFLCGMALGFDMICAETILQFKVKYKSIKLIGAIPCKNQDCKWNNEQKIRYRKLIKQLDDIRCIHDEYNGHECMLERNNYMVNNSSKMIALFNGLPGGTKKTIDYAKQRG